MTVDPKTSMYINILVAVLAAIAGGTISMSEVMPPEAAKLVVGYSTFLVSIFSVINAVLHGASSVGQGPLVNKMNDVARLLTFVLFITVAGSFSLNSYVYAEGRAPSPAPQKVEKATSAPVPGAMGKKGTDLLKSIQAVVLPDLQYASAIAHAHNDAISYACWDAWAGIIQAEQAALTDESGKPIDPPTIHIITDIQRVININNALNPTSPLAVACAPLANKVKLDVLALITQVAAGTLASGLLIP